MIFLRHNNFYYFGLIIIIFCGCQANFEGSFAKETQKQLHLQSIQYRSYKVKNKQNLIRAVIKSLGDLDFFIEKFDSYAKQPEVKASKLINSNVVLLISISEPKENNFSVRVQIIYEKHPIYDQTHYRKFFDILNLNIKQLEEVASNPINDSLANKVLQDANAVNPSHQYQNSFDNFSNPEGNAPLEPFFKQASKMPELNNQPYWQLLMDDTPKKLTVSVQIKINSITRGLPQNLVGNGLVNLRSDSKGRLIGVGELSMTSHSPIPNCSETTHIGKAPLKVKGQMDGPRIYLWTNPNPLKSNKIVLRANEIACGPGPNKVVIKPSDMNYMFSMQSPVMLNLNGGAVKQIRKSEAFGTTTSLTQTFKIINYKSNSTNKPSLEFVSGINTLWTLEYEEISKALFSPKKSYEAFGQLEFASPKNDGRVTGTGYFTTKQPLPNDVIHSKGLLILDGIIKDKKLYFIPRVTTNSLKLANNDKLLIDGLSKSDTSFGRILNIYGNEFSTQPPKVLPLKNGAKLIDGQGIWRLKKKKARGFARLGDKNSGGGKILEGSPSVRINGRSAARIGDKANCGKNGQGKISSGIATVVINGRLAAGAGDMVDCDVKIIEASEDVLTN